MSILLSGSLISSITSQIANIESQMVEANQKMLDMQSFAASISDGSFSMDDMMNTPGSMFNRTMTFTQSSNQIAMMSAQQKMAYVMRMPGAVPQIADPRAQQMYMQAMFKSFYDQGKTQIVEVERKKLHVEETKLQQKISMLEARKKMLEKYLDNAKNDQDKSIERFIGKG